MGGDRAVADNNVILVRFDASSSAKDGRNRIDQAKGEFILLLPQAIKQAYIHRNLDGARLGNIARSGRGEGVGGGGAHG